MFFRFLLIIYILNGNLIAREISNAANTVRSLGMGGAGSATIDGLDSLFVNPAGLNRNKGIYLTVVNPAITMNTSAWDSLRDYSQLAGGTNLREYIQPFVGKPFGIEMNNYTGLTLKNFGIAFFTDVELHETLHNLALPELRMKTYYQYGLKFGGATGMFKDDMVKFGLAVKWLNLRGVSDTATTETLLSMNGNEFVNWIDRSGRGYGLDMGTIVEIPLSTKLIKPCIALTWQDIFSTTVKSTVDGKLNPLVIHDNLILGLGTMFELPLMKINWALDVKHLTEREVQIPLKIHTGMEFIFPVLNFSIGLNQGYYTAAIGLNMFLLKIQVATYGTELGIYPGQKEDRRYVVQFIGSFSLFN